MTDQRAAAAPPGRLQTRHGDLALPAFLPDATRAVVRSLDSADLSAAGVEAIVVNSFHLMRAPGTRLIKTAGGVHRFMGWNGPVVSDSGGFQVYSLIRQNPNAGTIRANEVIFKEPGTGEKIVMTPEKCVQLQFQLGSDVVMCLDDCTNADDPVAEQERSVERTVRWAQRCKQEFEKLLDAGRRGKRGRAERARNTEDDGVASVRHERTEADRRPLLFAVVQGGGEPALRRQCAGELAAMGFDGFGYGGWPIDSTGALLSEMMGLVVQSLPAGAPLHALGVGRPDHVVRAAALGYTVFDCSLPTRDARHRRLYSFLPGMERGPLSVANPFFDVVYILDTKHANDFGPVDPSCDALCCTRYSRAYLRHLFKIEDATAERLASIHNLRFYTRLIDRLRRQHAIQLDTAPEATRSPQQVVAASGHTVELK